MSGSGLLLQLLNGLADASALFLVAAGLSLIFGVTRVVNFAHGSFYMLGIYLAWTFTGYFGGGAGYWAGLLRRWPPASSARRRAPGAQPPLRRARAVPAAGHLRAAAHHRRRHAGPVGPGRPVLRPRPGLAGAVEILGRRYPQYDLLLIAAGPIVLGLLWLLLMRTRWGRLLRAASENRSMLAALGVNQAWLFTSAFTLGAFLAGLGGALAAPHAGHAGAGPGSHRQRLRGGGGGRPGFDPRRLPGRAADQPGQVPVRVPGPGADRPWVFNLSKLTLLAEFAVMAVVLVARPWGLMGKPPAPGHAARPERPITPPASACGWRMARCWRC